MKTKMMTLALVTALAPAAHAGSLQADFRIDHNRTDYNEDATAASASLLGSSRFRMQTGRLDYKGQLNEDVSFRARLRFNRSVTGGVNTRDNLNTAVDFANVSNKLGNGFTLTLGKLGSEMGGFEGNTSSPDMYLTSVSYAGTGLLGGTSSKSLKEIMLYYTGAQLTYAFNDEHKLSLHFVNQEGSVGLGYGAASGDDNSGAGGSFAQNKMMTGLVYRGSLLDKSLGLIASYHAEDIGYKENKAAFAALGVEYKWSDFTVQLDYLMNQFQIAGATTNPKQSLNTAVATIKYKISPLWNAILKGAESAEKFDVGSIAGVTSEIENKYTDLGAALEYIPQTDQVFRYHIAYNYRSMKPDADLASNKTRSMTEILVGTRILADFLK